MTSAPTLERTCGQVLDAFATAIDAQDWPGLRALLADDFAGSWVHTGETFDADRFVALNEHYPGSWRFEPQRIVDAGPSAVLHARVSDDAETYHVASFARSRGGRLTELVEVWTEPVGPAPERTLS